MAIHKATFRFYEELNDVLPPPKRKNVISYEFSVAPSVKDAIEAIGVPHTEIDLIVVNGESVGFDYKLRDGDRVAVYPTFESMDISPVTRLRREPLRSTAFIADVHLGKLARILRLLGLDTAFNPAFSPAEVKRVAGKEQRIILTRSRSLLRSADVTHGYLVRSADPLEQAREVLDRFDLRRDLKPFTRCTACNGMLCSVPMDEIRHRLPRGTAARFREFRRCSGCDKVYWKGAHVRQLNALVEQFLGNGETPGFR